MPHRLIVLAAVGAVAGVVVIGRTTPAREGSATTLSPPAASAQALPSQAIPMASPTPKGASSGVPGTGPISGLFGELNRDTQHAAAGQLSILHDIAGALRGWIEHLLRASTGAH
jgi:hypothetical protein